MRFCLVIVAAALAVGCGESSGCGPTDPQICEANRSVARQLAGGWQEVGSPGGTNFVVTLAAHDASLIGSGSYASTSGMSGRTTILGIVSWRDSFFAPSGFEVPAAPTITLDFTFGNRTARLDQATISGDTMNGAITFSEDPFTTYVVKFSRVLPPAL